MWKQQPTAASLANKKTKVETEKNSFYCEKTSVLREKLYILAYVTAIYPTGFTSHRPIGQSHYLAISLIWLG